jgi:hypothetical protein
MRTREWTIRTRIISLLVIPITSLIVLWVFATSLTVGSASNLLATQVNHEEVGEPTEALIGELQRERKFSIVVLRSVPPDLGELQRQRRRTDKVVADFRAHANGERLRDSSPAETLRRVDDLVAALQQLPGIRAGIDNHQQDRTGALRLYSSLIERVYRIYYAFPGIDEDSISRDTRTIIALSRAREYLSQEDAVLAGVSSVGHFEVGEPGQLAELIGTQRFLFSDNVVELPSRDQSAYRRALLGETGQALRLMEDSVLADSRVNEAVPIDMAAWHARYQMLNQQLRDAELAAWATMVDRSRPIGIMIYVRLALAALIGLFAVVATVVASVRAGRSVVRRLTDLERMAQRIATERLPAVVLRLRKGEEVDLATEMPPIDFGTDEIGRVASAFEAVQRTAFEAAAQEARTRAGLSKIFLNIARRSQTLLHRQLTQLDKMERRTIDPDQLQELFRVDHLATRMRRNAEDLVVLAGATPARGWRNPVAVVDVIRGAISEVEEYTRVTIQSVPDVAVSGPAVGDTIHLLAELIENATSFSPPNSSVLLSAQVVPKGLAIDVEDRGIGMSSHDLEEANQRLADPPEFDPEASARLGLFVVATLAGRHNVKVSLRRSTHDGVTAVVLLPSGLIVSDRTVSFPPIRPGTRPPTLAAAATPLRVTAAPSDVSPVEGPSAGPMIGRATAPVTEPASNGRPPEPPRLSKPLPATDDGGDDAPPLTPDGLPKRRRQGHISEKLKETPPTGQVMPGQTGAQPRSPEQIRSTMSALQAGLHRGRRDADEQLSGSDQNNDAGQPTEGALDELRGDPGTTFGEDEGWRA